MPQYRIPPERSEDGGDENENLLDALFSRQRPLTLGSFILPSVVFSELLTAAANTIQSYLWYGAFSPTLLMIGAIDARFAAVYPTHAGDISEGVKQCQLPLTRTLPPSAGSSARPARSISGPGRTRKG